MKPSDWVRQNNGLDYERAYRLYRMGRFPRPEQPPTGTILVHELPNETNDAVLYARVSSSDQKEGRHRKAAGEYERFHSGNRPACDWGIQRGGFFWTERSQQCVSEAQLYGQRAATARNRAKRAMMEAEQR